MRYKMHPKMKQKLKEYAARKLKPKSQRRLVVVMLDDDRKKVSAGDTVRFNYGIPPVCVIAKLVQRGNKLIALTPGHKPKECNLRSLRKHVGGWFKHNAKVQP